MTVFTEGRHPAEFIMSEASGKRSREAVTVGASQTIVPGQVLGVLKSGSAAVTVSAPTIVGTGDGVLTKANPANSASVKAGTYTVLFVTPEDTGVSQFEVLRPDGSVDGAGAIGVAYDGEVKFTVADGSADFIAGSKITLAVSIADQAGAGEYVAYDQDAVTGAEVAVAVAIYGCTTGVSETASIAAIVRDAEVNGNILTWHTDATDGEKAAGCVNLAKTGIIVR